MSNARTRPTRSTASTLATTRPRPRPRKGQLTLEQLFQDPPPFAFRPGTALSPEEAPWIIYVLTHLDTGQCYVGLSVHTLGERISRHLYSARRVRRVRDGGLMAALRTMLGDGRTFEDTFTARVVARATTAAEAAAQEACWVEMLQSMAPHGLNQMPPGGVGSVSNAQAVVVEVAPGERQRYHSIYAAIGDANIRRRRSGGPPLDPSVAYTRLTAKWTLEEALGYRPHRDGRSERAAFCIAGRTYTSLREASAATGVTMDALRSRLHRDKQRALNVPVPDPDADAEPGMPDITADRRLECLGREASLGLVWPGTGEDVTAAEFGVRTGVRKATVIHRAHRVRAEQQARFDAGLDPLTPEEVHERLVTRTERMSELRLRLPNGEHWEGGERALIRRVFALAELERSRPERLSESGIRRRLHLLSPEARRDPGMVAGAFGLRVAGPWCAGPVAPTQRRRKG